MGHPVVTRYDDDIRLVADPLISVKFTDQHDPVLGHGHLGDVDEDSPDLRHVDQELLLTDLTDSQDRNEEDSSLVLRTD